MPETTGEPDLTPALRDLHTMVRVRLARHAHRYTPGRRRLVEALAGAGRPVTLSEIALSHPDLSVSSTYRNLEVLERSRVVNRISIRGDRAYFELAEPLLSHHHHLVCVACGAIEDIHLDDELEDLVDRNLAEAARRAAFTPLRHLLDLHGHCSRCEPPPLRLARPNRGIAAPTPLKPGPRRRCQASKGPRPSWSRTVTTGGLVIERRNQLAPSTTSVCPEMNRP